METQKLLAMVNTYISTKGTQKVAMFQNLCGVVAGQEEGGRDCTKEYTNVYNMGGRVKGVPTILPLHVLMKIGTFLGGEVFYSLAIPLVLLGCDYMIFRRFVTLWFMLYYVGQYLKDLLQLPRPLSPPALKLEHLDEYGMPSTHAMGAAGTSIYLAIMLPEISNYQLSTWLTVPIAILWTLTVCISRVYMGSHTFEDIIGGLLLCGSILMGFRSIETELDSLFLKTDYMPLYLLAIVGLLLYIYPRAPGTQWSESFGDTAIIAGVFSGTMCGFWYFARFGTEPEFGWLIDEISVAPKELLAQLQNVQKLLFWCVAAVILVPAVFLTKAIVKTVVVKVLKAYFKEGKSEKTYWTEGMGKLLGYFAVGITQVIGTHFFHGYSKAWLAN
eukprot:TRINITY_DN22171_c0_g1_i1.p1 TRINITY_DN22171_c0_g1~~TRINITY_DN22171_c0_g1_i1.p1  ORF type:complete len:386 (-),score=67.76 TRINITY_DN22171_c0_g1_i1:9-1166(-)